jgi:hypothetical protein
LLVGIGSALVAFGAFLALAVAIAPTPGADVVGQTEHERRLRNATLATGFAAATGFAGAVLLLTAAWPWAFLTVVGVGLLYLAVLAWGTHRDWTSWARWVRLEREADHDSDGNLGRVTLGTAAAFKVAPDTPEYQALAGAFFGPAGDEGYVRIAEHVQKTAEERARVTWAIRHPFGAGLTPREIWRFTLLRVRYRLDTAQQRRRGQPPASGDL